MKSFAAMLETYLMVLVHPFRIHHQFRHQLALPGQDGHLLEPLKLPEALALSWVFAIIRGLFKIVILNFFLNAFVTMQNHELPFLQEILYSSGLSTYYFLLFSASLDIIFFPISALVVTELWAWVIRRYSKWLNPDQPHEDIADQITTHALSSNLFSIVPVLGDLFQFIMYFFLLYAGIRTNLGASRTLAVIILISPLMVTGMLICILAFTVFCLV